MPVNVRGGVGFPSAHAVRLAQGALDWLKTGSARRRSRPLERRFYCDNTTALLGAPAGDAPLETEALMGERVRVYEVSDEGWAWGQLEADGYVGYLPANALAAPGRAPTFQMAWRMLMRRLLPSSLYSISVSARE